VHILTRAAFPAIWMQLTKGIPYIITEHWSRYLPVNVARNAYSGFLRKLFTRFAVSRARAVTTVTVNLAEAMKLLGLKNEYHVTPNVVNIHDFKPDETKSTPLIKRLVHVSCFDEPAKNIKGIINAVQKIALSRNDFLLEIIGDGKDYNDVQKHAEKTGLINSRIYFTGLLTGNLLEEKMRAADALVMFSNYENLPCTIIESLSCGVPVISTDVGGIREHLHNDFGILIEQGNEIALIAAINEMLDNPGKFNSQEMRKYSEAHFSMEAIGNLFNSLYLNSSIR